MFFFCCFFFAKPLKGEETCRRRSELAVINALFYFSCGLSTIKLFLYLSEREGKLCLKKISEKKNTLLIPIYVFITVFLFFLIRQTELLPGSVGTVCLCMRENAAFYCSPLMFKLFSLRVFAVVPVSCTSFLGLYCPGACTPGTERGCWYTACVCVCEREGRERDTQRGQLEFSQTLGQFIQPSHTQCVTISGCCYISYSNEQI